MGIPPKVPNPNPSGNPVWYPKKHRKIKKITKIPGNPVWYPDDHNTPHPGGQPDHQNQCSRTFQQVFDHNHNQ